MSIGGGASSGNSNSVTQLDPDLKNAWLSLYGQSMQTADSPPPQQAVAGQTPTGIAGGDMTLKAAGAGQDLLGDAASRTQALGSQAPSYAGTDHYSVHQAQAPDAGLYSFRDVSPDSSLYGYRDVQAPGFSDTDLSKYQNPYQQQVIDASMADLDRARQTANNGVQSTLTSSGGEGAWNGARAGVERSLNDDAYMRNAAQTSAQLHQQGFDTATGLMKDYGQLGLAAGQANQQADLARSGALYGGALSAGQANQQADLAKAGTVYGANLTTGMSNAAAETEKERENSARDNATMQFNAGQDNAQRQLELAAADQQARQAGQQQQMALTGAQAVTGVGEAQRQIQQKQYDADYQNSMSLLNFPLQTRAMPFGIIPTVQNGSSQQSHSNGKSGNFGAGV